MTGKLAGILSIAISLAVAGCSSSGSSSNNTVSSDPTVVPVSLETSTENIAQTNGASNSNGGSNSSDSDTAANTDDVASTDEVANTDNSTNAAPPTGEDTGTQEGLSEGTSTDADTNSQSTDEDAAAQEEDTPTESQPEETEEEDTPERVESEYAIGSLADIIVQDGSAGLALADLKVAGLDFALNDATNVWTVFLPTDDAILANPSFDISSHIHTVSALTADALNELNGSTIAMNNGDTFAVDGGGVDPLTIGGVEVLTVDLVGNTGSTVVHIINSVLSTNPEPEYPTGTLLDIMLSLGAADSAIALLKSEGLDLAVNDSTNEWTVFLPNDAAIDAGEDFTLMSHIHVEAVLSSDALTGLSGSSITLVGDGVVDIEGGGTEPLTVGSATVVAADIQAISGGSTIHIIDTVLNFP